MVPFEAHSFYQIAKRLTEMEHLVKNAPGEISDHNQDVLSITIRSIISSCRAIGGLAVSIKYADGMLKWLDEGKRNYPEVVFKITILRERIEDELSLNQFLSLSQKEADHYENFLVGWEEIIKQFKEILRDVEEARKCFALSRYSATVFHSLQIVEAGIIRLGQFVSVPDPRPGWTATLNELNKILKKDYNSMTEFEQFNRDFFEQVRATIEALNTAWRNKISHVDGKLKVMTADFPPEIAEEILYASRAFMRRLAEGLKAFEPPIDI